MHRLAAATMVFGCALVAGSMAAAGAAGTSGVAFVVTKLAEEREDVDTNPGDGICATAGGGCTLPAAVQETNALPGPQLISLPPGEHPLSRGGYAENAADYGDLDITDDLTIAGAGQSETAVSFGQGGRNGSSMSGTAPLSPSAT